MITSLTNDIQWAEEKHFYLTQPFIQGTVSIVSKDIGFGIDE